MKRILLAMVLLISAISVQADRLRGIRINSFGDPVIVFFGGNQMCPPSTTCFVTNLKSGFYTVEVYESRPLMNNEPEWRGRLLYRERVYYNGLGITDINIPRAYERREYDRRNHYDRRRDMRDERFHRPMVSDSFNSFISALEREGFDSRRNKLLRTACDMNNFTVGQCRLIMEQYSFDDGKLEAFKMLFPRILDKEDVFVLGDCFSFSSNKEKMMQYILSRSNDRELGGLGMRGYVMSDEAFQNFMRSFRRESFSGDKERLLNLCIDANWLTVNQCREIVQELRFESEKVKVMKKLFPKVADKGNFFTLLDCLSFSSSKRDVERFIAKYREY